MVITIKKVVIIFNNARIGGKNKMMIRNITDSDINTIIDLWNYALPHEAIDKKAFLKKLLLDPNFKPKGFFVAEEEGELLGFVNCPYFKSPAAETGFISILAIKDRERVIEVGNLLLDKAEEYIASNGKKRISTGYAPLYFTQGVEKDLCPEYVELYRSRGYSEKESYKRVCDLSNYVYPQKCIAQHEALAKEGIYVGEMKDEYLLSLTNPNPKFAKKGWSFEFKNRLAECDYARVRIAAKDGEMIGCCVFGDPNGSPERFGPFGVNEDMRGKGLGTLLLNDCFFEMKKRGLQSAWAQWTPVEGPASILYDHYGFEKRNSYLMFEKEL